jgi:hypothetical protein
MILIVSFGMQSFLQPYEPIALHVLDSLGIFCLFCTQILSILYQYCDTKDGALPYDIDKKLLEFGVTTALFVLNCLALLSFAAAWVIAMLNLDRGAFRCNKRVTMRLIVDQEVVQRELVRGVERDGREGGDGKEGDGGGADVGARTFRWKHPTKDTTVDRAPFHASRFDNGVETDLWIWFDEEGKPECMSTNKPQLLQLVGAKEDPPLPGEFVCYFDVKLKETSPLVEVPNDTGGLSLLCKKTPIRPRFGAAIETSDVVNPDALHVGAVLGDTVELEVDGGPTQLAIDVRLVVPSTSAAASTATRANPMLRREPRKRRSQHDSKRPSAHDAATIEMTTLAGSGGSAGGATVDESRREARRERRAARKAKDAQKKFVHDAEARV